MLHLQAQVWRYLMSIGMLLHRMAPPRPPKPNFSLTIPSTVSTNEGTFNLYFYVPKGYEQETGRKKSPGITPIKRRKSVIDRGGYPCIINFHGGGFTLGTSTDDGRWCGTVVAELKAVVVSVEYRLAPENPFPTAVEDGVDAVLYIANHAHELGINPAKIALSGFSSGANMAFTVPLRLYDHMTEFSRTQTRDDTDGRPKLLMVPSGRPQTLGQLASASTTSVNRILRSRSSALVAQRDEDEYLSTKAAKTSVSSLPDSGVTLAAIVPWYPSTDYTQTREQKRGSSGRADQELPRVFSDLFDESYLHPPDTIPLDSPYLSPGIADESLLREALPQEIIMHTCEWDMLLAEGERFKERLIAPGVNKHVVYKLIEGVPHGWDKAPNPLKPTPGVKEHYLRACDELRRVFAEVDKKQKSGKADGFGAGVFNASEAAGETSASGSASVNESAISLDSDSDIELEESFGRQGRRKSNFVN